MKSTSKIEELHTIEFTEEDIKNILLEKAKKIAKFEVSQQFREERVAFIIVRVKGKKQTNTAQVILLNPHNDPKEEKPTNEKKV